MKKAASVALAAMMITAVCAPVTPIDISIRAEAATVKPAAPTGLKAVVSGSMVKLTWDKVSGVDGYRVYIYDFTAKKYKRYKDVKGTSCEAKSLKSGKNYLFKVAAVKDGTVGVKSEKVTVTVSSSSTKWVDAYKKVLLPYKNGTIEDAMCPMCSLYDITGDGVPELFVSANDAHASGAEIYSYHNGKLVRYSYRSAYDNKIRYKFGSWGGVIVLPEAGVIVNSYTGNGTMSDRIYRIDGDKISLLLTSETIMEWGDTSEQYTVNGKKATKSEYDKTMAPYMEEGISLGRTYLVGDKHTGHGHTDCDNIDDIFDKMQKGSQ